MFLFKKTYRWFYKMSIVKCEKCEQDIDLDFEDADYTNKGWLHVDCEGENENK